MNFRREITLLVALAAFALGAAPAFAQYPPQGMDPRMAYGPPGGMAPPGVQPAYYGDPAAMGPMPGGPMGPMPGGPMGMPPGPMGPGGPMGPMPGGPMQGGPMGPMPQPEGYCDQCGGQGCEACGGCGGCGGCGCGLFSRGGLLDCGCDGHCCDWIHSLFSEGHRCRPRWFDVQVDFVSLKRDTTSRLTDFASDGVGGPIVLDSDDLTMGTGNGARVTGAWLIGPGTAFEASWMGGFFWQDNAVLSQQNDLFSPFDDFGTGGGAAAFLADVDDASVVGISYNSKLDTVELSIRQRFQEPECRYQGSFLYGFRYIRLVEQFNYVARGTSGANFADIDVSANNNLYGAQVGYEFNMRPLPRIMMDAQWKIGLYGNSSDATNSVVSTSIPGGFSDQSANTEIAFASELNFNIMYNVSERWTFRTGYNLFYVDGVALGVENLNTGIPGARDPSINVNGSLFVHGYNVGFEYNW